MKVYLPNDSKMSMGGAWTFKRNLAKGASQIQGLEITDNEEEADAILIAGATMITRDSLIKYDKQWPTILRVDGVPEDWRNSGRGWGQLKAAYIHADAVIYQSEFSREMPGSWLANSLVGKKNTVILNGVDHAIFKPTGKKLSRFGEFALLNVNSRKDPNKRIEEVIHLYRVAKPNRPGLTLTLVGKYPTYLRSNNFGLYDYEPGKDWQYLGIVNDPEYMAKIMRSCDMFIFPSFADSCPNTLIEFLATRAEYSPADCHTSVTGGSSEITEAFEKGYDFSLANMAAKYRNFIQEVVKNPLNAQI